MERRQPHETALLSMETLEELKCLYTMLRDALPLAREKLVHGGVSLADQEDFWRSYSDLGSYGDFDNEDYDETTGIIAAIDELDNALKAARQKVALDTSYNYSPNEDLAIWIRHHDSGPIGTRVINQLLRVKVSGQKRMAFIVPADFGNFSKEELCRIQNVGKCTIDALEKWLLSDGIALKAACSRPNIYWERA